MLCQYSDMFGKPGTGLHRFRILDIAIIDVVLTMIGAYFLSRFYRDTEKSFTLVYLKYLLYLFLLGIFLHRLFCVRTTIDKLLFR